MLAAPNFISNKSSNSYWPQPQNPSYLVSSAFAQQWSKYLGRPSNSLSMDPQTRNTNSLYDKNPSLFFTSMGSCSVQQQQLMNTSQQPFPQPTEQDFMRTPGHCSTRSSLTPTYYPLSPRSPSLRLIKQSPNASPAPSNRISPLPTYSHSNVRQQNDRPFKCDQCPQSFNRNHDLKRHKRIHLAVKPFTCGYCGKSFSRKDTLKVCSSFDLIRRLEQGDS